MFWKLLVQAVVSEVGSGMVEQEMPEGVVTPGRGTTVELISGE
jgi:hypothetical protein